MISSKQTVNSERVRPISYMPQYLKTHLVQSFACNHYSGVSGANVFANLRTLEPVTDIESIHCVQKVRVGERVNLRS